MFPSWRGSLRPSSLQWCHIERDSVSHHQHHDCLPNRLFRHRSKKTSKLRATGLCAGNSPVTGEFPAQRASNAENASIWWCHNVICIRMPITGKTDFISVAVSHSARDYVHNLSWDQFMAWLSNTAIIIRHHSETGRWLTWLPLIIRIATQQKIREF